tara:strand:+ start:6861 stop:7226 length:366 start_codon:yes stop_codon:yes gene_type:complete
METIKSNTFQTGDNVAVHKMEQDLVGGVELDMTGLETAYAANADFIPDGTPIIDTAGVYSPLTAATLVADGPKVVGFLFQSIPVSAPHASVAIRGTVNEARLPFAIDAAVKTAVKGAISFI